MHVGLLLTGMQSLAYSSAFLSACVDRPLEKRPRRGLIASASCNKTQHSTIDLDWQVLEDEMVADLPQWLAECSSAGESATAAKQFGVAGIVFTAVGLRLWPV